MKVRKVYLMTVGELLDYIEKEEAVSSSDIEKIFIEKGKLIGAVPEETDGDMITGELRDIGVKVLNLNEQVRKKKHDKN